MKPAQTSYPDNTNIRFLRWRWWALGPVGRAAHRLGCAGRRCAASTGASISSAASRSASRSRQARSQIGELRDRLEALGVGDVVDPADRVMVAKWSTSAFRCKAKVATRIGQMPVGAIRCRSQGKGCGRTQVNTRSHRKVRAEHWSGLSRRANVRLRQSVSGKVSCELVQHGRYCARRWPCSGIALFIWFRFEWQFGVGALVTLFHDVVLTFGFFALTQLAV